MRIVSFAPSVTEVLYELGVGDRVVGVTSFCAYPAEAKLKEKIGTYASFNYEAVVRLKPDLAVILKEQREQVDFLERYGIRYVAVGNDSVDEILESIVSVAEACFVRERGEAVVSDLRRRMDLVSARIGSPQTEARPKVLLCVDRENIGTGAVGGCFAAGASSFYDQLIEMAGGKNALAGVRQSYPSVGAEAVARLDPDVIIDLSGAYLSRDGEASCGDWAALKSVSAVKAGRVHCLRGDYLTVPGPRFVKIAEDIRGVLEIVGRAGASPAPTVRDKSM